jgi:AcrR family transcriptional regulator
VVEIGSAAPQAKGARRPRQRSRRGEEVLNTAAAVFARRGYADASVQDVAAALNITKSTMYHYISSKEDLLFWLVERVHDDVDSILYDVIALSNLGPLERLFEYTRLLVHYAISHMALTSVSLNDTNKLSIERLREIEPRRVVHDNFVQRMIAEAQKRGEVDPTVDIPLAAASLIAVTIWPYRWYDSTQDLPAETVAHECARFAVAGVCGLRPPSLFKGRNEKSP